MVCALLSLSHLEKKSHVTGNKASAGIKYNKGGGGLHGTHCFKGRTSRCG